MEEKIIILAVKETEALFECIPSDEMHNIELIHTRDASELVRFVYVFNPHIVVFNIACISEDNFEALLQLKKESGLTRYQALFLRTQEEARSVVKAFRSGVNPHYLKLFQIMEKNARILDFLELRQARDEMVHAFHELKHANLEVKRKSKQLQQAINSVEKLATTDYLTGVYNRRYAIERIKQEIIRYKRTQRIFSFVICDIDNFKTINDTYGHAYGDLLLVEIARHLSECCREIDVLSRWGGDEFLFILPETDAQGARTFSERLRKSIYEKHFEYGHSKITVSITFGISEYDNIAGANESIKNADNALLAGKNTGRNKVVTSDEITGKLPNML